MVKPPEFLKTGALVLFFSALVACSPGCSASPTAPSAGRVAGAWLANSTLATASGGACVGDILRSRSGSRDVFTAAVRQDGTILSATVASQGNGTTCAYSGSVDGNALSLNMTSCQAARVVGAPCGNGELLDLQLVSGTVAANVDAQLGSGSGRETSSWAVYAAGSTTPVDTLTLTANFTWIFLGLPPSDYHVFTGTIFPGYDDGTISIPADPTPFCSKCGWF
ncbi:MAG: hypothetical protein ABJA98_08750 [Acidobacteriota bacterium]